MRNKNSQHVRSLVLHYSPSMEHQGKKLASCRSFRRGNRKNESRHISRDHGGEFSGMKEDRSLFYLIKISKIN